MLIPRPVAAVPVVARNIKVFDLREAEATAPALSDLPDELYRVTGVHHGSLHASVANVLVASWVPAS
jgi:hypothetical protein